MSAATVETVNTPKSFTEVDATILPIPETTAPKAEKPKAMPSKELVGAVSRLSEAEFTESFGIGESDVNYFQTKMDELYKIARRLFGDAPTSDHEAFGNDCVALILWERKRE
jgi:hypothetical protein